MLGLSPGQPLDLRLLDGEPAASVEVEPASIEDFEVLEQNCERIE